MENKILGQFKIIYLGKLIIYQDRIEITSPIKSNIIPANKIANVSYNKLSGRLTIETSGGAKTRVGFWGGYEVGNEALRLISSLK